MVDFSKRRMQLLGIEVPSVTNSLTPKDLKDLLSVRWRSPKNSCEEICHRIYLGGEKAAKDIDFLQKLGVTHILNAAGAQVHISGLYYQNRNFMCSQLALPIVTTEERKFQISDYFEEAARYIESCLKKPSGKILIHDDDEGVTSGPILLTAYLMIKRGLDLMSALKIVRSKRQIYPNECFLAQLIQLDKDLDNKRKNAYPF